MATALPELSTITTSLRLKRFVAGVFVRLATEWEGYRAVPERYIAEGDTVVALGHYSRLYLRPGKRFRAPLVHV